MLAGGHLFDQRLRCLSLRSVGGLDALYRRRFCVRAVAGQSLIKGRNAIDHSAVHEGFCVENAPLTVAILNLADRHAAPFGDGRDEAIVGSVHTVLHVGQRVLAERLGLVTLNLVLAG
ncbi:hypothetical protein D3C80_1460530 [compost metagenome]